jgi:hypothetical protein
MAGTSTKRDRREMEQDVASEADAAPVPGMHQPVTPEDIEINLKVYKEEIKAELKAELLPELLAIIQPHMKLKGVKAEGREG